MSIKLKEFWSSAYEIVFVFANTGLEHPDTLRFAHEVDTRYGLNLVWLEARVNEPGKSTGHTVVNYENASRAGEPFEAVVARYGLPNHTFKLCTRELKMNTMKSYMRSLGWDPGTYYTAIGIRSDEKRRVSPSAEVQHILYPLADPAWWPVDKEDVLQFFEGFAWDLNIKEHEGNCVTCYKKSHKKLQRLYNENPQYFEFPIKLDNLYKRVGPNDCVPGNPPRKMFRGHMDTRELIESFKGAEPQPDSSLEGPCSESCEVYETQIVTN